jgi:hypothetical protein
LDELAVLPNDVDAFGFGAMFDYDVAVPCMRKAMCMPTTGEEEKTL